MREEIIDGLNDLYRLFKVEMIMTLILVGVLIIITILAFKLKLCNSLRNCIILAITTAICSVTIIILRIHDIIPVYNDYKEQSYIVVENAKVTLDEYGCYSEGLHDVYDVFVVSGEDELTLRIIAETCLGNGIEYTGTIAYSEHSGYVIWFSLNE